MYRPGDGSEQADSQNSDVSVPLGHVAPVITLVGLDAHEALHLKHQIMMIQGYLINLKSRVDHIEERQSSSSSTKRVRSRKAK